MLTYDKIRKNPAIQTYIQTGNEVLGAIGYTEHGFAHAAKTAETAAHILLSLGFDERTAELAKIAGYLHDIGNMVNRENHALTGATIAFTLLQSMGMEPTEIAKIVSAIGNHDESAGKNVTPIAAALILADKSDVRRSRVRWVQDVATLEFIEDIHDRVNYAAKTSSLALGCRGQGNYPVCGNRHVRLPCDGLF
jgi:putative nucleotidyltransferase with HDIG domain